MKSIILMLLLVVTTAHGGWFDNKEQQQRLQATEQQLVQQRQSTGQWQIIAGVLAVGAISLLFVGAALGSKIRRHGTYE